MDDRCRTALWWVNAFFGVLLWCYGVGAAQEATPRIVLRLPAATEDDKEEGGLRLRLDESIVGKQDVPGKKSGKKKTSAERPVGAYQSGPFEVSGVRIVDINTGRVVPVDTVDLKPTLHRIASGGKHAHRNDGSIFRNLERNLPRKPRDYYREYVVPTEGVRGPGPQRLVIGKGGEFYYTYDHYDTFIHIEKE